MRWRALNLEFRTRLKRVGAGRKLDVLITHAPRLAPHRRRTPPTSGSSRFSGSSGPCNHCCWSMDIHPYGKTQPERWVGGTRVINAIPSRMIDL